ncbi:MAG: hypothetical protein IKE00_02325 [Oscillospiraceae bacterium]|nr:hypothetical protein [Oscillospiraceae bacterium]
MKNKKGVGKKILLIVLIVILVCAIADICVAETGARRIPHRFASAEEGKELLLANSEYYSRFSQKDIDYRMKKEGATMEELLRATTDEIRNFNLFEKYLMDRRIAKMARQLKKNGYALPKLETITYIKTDMSVEGSQSGYTHGNEIYLNSTNILFSFIPGASEFFDHLLWHELFHCLTRNNPGFRAEMYSLIHFTVADFDFELPPDVRENYHSNPDVEHHNAYATFLIDGKETDCFLAWIFTGEEPASFESTAVLIPIDGTDTFYLPEQASNFDEVFGNNNDYKIDPEEYMANNFADAMQYGLGGRNGQSYPNPEIIQGVMDCLRK